MTDSVVKPRDHRTLIVLFGPAALTLIALSLAKLIGVTYAGALIPALAFVTPVVGVVSIASIPMSGLARLVFIILYYPVMLGFMFLLGLMFGCGALKLFCW